MYCYGFASVESLVADFKIEGEKRHSETRMMQDVKTRKEDNTKTTTMEPVC